jgi:hypothetical protein
MLDLHFSNKPLTVGDLIDVQKMQAGDVEAAVRLVVSRSDATEAALRDLPVDEWVDVSAQLSKALVEADKLYVLSRQMKETLPDA